MPSDRFIGVMTTITQFVPTGECLFEDSTPPHKADGQVTLR